jgi:hypothetical protein
MPSNLIGLIRKLNWADFKGPVPSGTTFAAATNVGFIVTTPRFVRDGSKVRLDDNVTVTVKFDEAKSWRISMQSWPAQLEQELLEHEQVHYDITALCARDLFIQLMALKSSSWTNAAEGTRDFNWWVTLYREKEDKIQKKYDSETGHSQANVFVPSTNMFTPPHQKGGPQQLWEKLVAGAFTTVNPKGGSAPDGTPYKIQLMDHLIKNGISF